MICSAYGNDLGISHYFTLRGREELFPQMRRGDRLRGRSFFWQFVNDTAWEASRWVMLVDPSEPPGSTHSLLKDGSSMPSFFVL